MSAATTAIQELIDELDLGAWHADRCLTRAAYVRALVRVKAAEDAALRARADRLKNQIYEEAAKSRYARGV